ncbi:MAG: nucleotidyltransferase domain-containing protein [Promethearchaeota archaeon]
MKWNNLDSFNLSKKADNYLYDIIKLLENYLKDRLISIVLFGSAIKGYSADESDVDILIIVSDDCNKKEINYLHQLIISFEIKYNFVVPLNGLISRILYCIDRSTGMFISHFITRKTDFLKGNFARTFQVNKFISNVLAPNKIVYGSVLCRAKILYGQNLIKEAKIPNIPIRQLFKSILMNIITSIFTLFIYPLTKRATLYEMETAKWSFLAAYYYIKHDSPPLPTLLKFFLDRNISTKYVKKWVALRNNYKQDLKFGLFTPLNILKIHMAILKYT